MLLIKRVIAYLIDYIIISIPIMILSMVIGTLPIFDVNGDYPFLIISFVFMPHIFWKNIFLYSNYYGNLLWVPCVVVAVIVFESVVYSIQQRLFKATLGNKLIKLRIASYNGKELTISRLFIWNIIKLFSKYLFPFVIMSYVFSKKKTTFYDSTIGIIVFEK